jgi:hypothetical protein
MDFIGSLLHPSIVDEYEHPPSVQQQIIEKALGLIPGAQKVIDIVKNPEGSMQDVLAGLLPHEPDDSGTLQWIFQN